jgi:hypothetical protein
MNSRPCGNDGSWAASLKTITEAHSKFTLTKARYRMQTQ